MHLGGIDEQWVLMTSQVTSGCTSNIIIVKMAAKFTSCVQKEENLASKEAFLGLWISYMWTHLVYPPLFLIAYGRR